MTESNDDDDGDMVMRLVFALTEIEWNKEQNRKLNAGQTKNCERRYHVV